MSILGLAIATLALSFVGHSNQDHRVETPEALAEVAHHAADAAIAKYADQNLKADQVGITLVRLDRMAKTSSTGSYHGQLPMYPASVVKLFYLAFVGKQIEEGKVILTPELERAIHDMIVDSINDATGLVLETITGTTGGPELPPLELAKWMKKRQIVNRWFAKLAYPKLNACQKTWNEGPYGRERQGYGPNFELKNSLSAIVCARLMSDIAMDRIVNPNRCAWMRKYLSRAIPADGVDTNDQSKLFSGKVLPAGSKLWSKAGWTDAVRHDVAYIRLPDGREYVWAIFTKDHSSNQDLIPFIASELLTGLG